MREREREIYFLFFSRGLVCLLEIFFPLWISSIKFPAILDALFPAVQVDYPLLDSLREPVINMPSNRSFLSILVVVVVQ